MSNVPFRWNLKEVILADTGIIFNRQKLMKFGVPGTEFEYECCRWDESPQHVKLCSIIQRMIDIITSRMVQISQPRQEHSRLTQLIQAQACPVYVE
jgi:hypothetical protein